MLILSYTRHCCQMPNHQFDFAVGPGCVDALFAFADILSDSEATDDPLVIGSFDLSRAFDSSVHAQILLEAYKIELNLCIVRVLYYMYNNLRAQIKIHSNLVESTVVLSVKESGKVRLYLRVHLVFKQELRAHMTLVRRREELRAKRS